MGLLVVLLLAASLIPAAGSAQTQSDLQRLLSQAQEHLRQQQWEKAREAARQALNINPRLAEAELMLGLIEAARSEFKTAEEHLLKAVSLRPESHQAHAYLGSIYLRQERVGEAARAFQKVLELNPGNSTAHYNLGVIALRQSELSLALSHFEAVHEADPVRIPALIGALQTQLRLQRVPQAKRSLQQLDALLPPEDPRLFQLATMFALHGDLDTAIPVLERVLRIAPDSYDVAYNLTLAYVQSEQYEKAAETLQPFLGHPPRAEAYNLSGTIEGHRGLDKEAILALQKAADLEPENEVYRFDYANILLQHDNIEAAKLAFLTAVRDFPASWRMKVGLASAHYLAGDYDGAAKELLESIKIDPKAKLAYYLLGKTYEFARSSQEAIRSSFRAYLQNEPDDPWAYYHYANALHLYGQAREQTEFEQAKSNLRRAVALDPLFAEAHLKLGIIAQDEGRFEESIQHLEQARRLKPGLAAAQYRLGLAYRREGSQGEAKAAFSAFQKLKAEGPSDDERQSIIKSLMQERNVGPAAKE